MLTINSHEGIYTQKRQNSPVKLEKSVKINPKELKIGTIVRILRALGGNDNSKSQLLCTESQEKKQNKTTFLFKRKY